MADRIVQVFAAIASNSTVMTAPSENASYPWSNVNDYRSPTKHWRSTSGATSATATIKVNDQFIFRGLSFIEANFTYARMLLYSDTAFGSLEYDSGTWTLQDDKRRRVVPFPTATNVRYYGFLHSSLSNAVAVKAIKVIMRGNPYEGSGPDCLKLGSLAIAYDSYNISTPSTAIPNVKDYSITGSVPGRSVELLSGRLDYFPYADKKQLEFDIDFTPVGHVASNVTAIERIGNLVQTTGAYILNEITTSRTSDVDTHYTYVCQPLAPSWSLTFNRDQVLERDRIRFREFV